MLIIYSNHFKKWYLTIPNAKNTLAHNTIKYSMKKVCIIHKVSNLDPRSFYKQGLSLVKAGYNTAIISFYKKDETISGVRLLSIKKPETRLNRLLFSNYNFFIRALKEKLHPQGRAGHLPIGDDYTGTTCRKPRQRGRVK